MTTHTRHYALVLAACVCSLSMSGCKSDPPKSIALKYTSGATFIEGQIFVSRGRLGFKKTTKSVGEWRYYYPNGTLMKLENYDANGVIKKNVNFDAAGDTIATTVYSDQKTVVTAFRKTGAVDWRQETKYPDSGKEPAFDQTTEYYDSGATAVVWQSVGVNQSARVFTPDGRLVFEGRIDNDSIKERFGTR